MVLQSWDLLKSSMLCQQFIHSFDQSWNWVFDINNTKTFVKASKTNIQKFDLQPLIKFLRGRKNALTSAPIVGELPYQASKLSRSHISA